MKSRPSDHCGWRSLQNSSQQELSSFKLLEMYFYPGPPGRAGENIFSICVSLIGILRVGIAKHHAVEVVSKSQPLKLNSERALTPTVCWQIQLADTVCMYGSSNLNLQKTCRGTTLALLWTRSPYFRFRTFSVRNQIPFLTFWSNV